MGYTNSPLATYTRISPNCNPYRISIDYLTIHIIVGQWTAKQGVDYFANPSLGVSPNYVVGKDGSIGQSVPEAYRSWCTGGDSPYKGYTGRDNDFRAITIETASDTYAPYRVTDAAFRALIDLSEDICKRNGKKRLLWFGDRAQALDYTVQPGDMVMTVHRWFDSKTCPGDYLYGRMGEIANEVNRRLKEEEDKVNYQDFVKYMDQYRKTLQDNDSSAWSKKAREWNVSKGIIAGSDPNKPNYMWEDFLTREQESQINMRLYEVFMADVQKMIDEAVKAALTQKEA